MSEIIKTTAVFQQLAESIQYVSKHSPFYQTHFSKETVKELTPERFRTLPFTSKEDLSLNNTDFLCVPTNQIAEYVTTSGTSGKPVTIYLTKNDLIRLGKNEKESFELTGAKAGDVFQLMTTIDKQFMAGLAYYLGVQELNAGMIRIGPGVPALQWNSILENKPTILIAVPSFLVNLIDYAKQNNIDINQTSVRSVICIGEPIREDDLSENVLAKRIHADWNVELFSTYASTEMGAAFTECTAHQGGHLNEGLIYLEVLDDDGKDVPNGEKGEIVISTLGTEGTPLIRYKTGDVARVYRDACPCGRTSPRVGPIIGRKNQMIKFKGTTIFPPSIYEIFDSRSEVSCYKIEVSKDYLGHDTITILLENRIEHSPVMTQIIEDCKAKLRVVPHFVFLESDYLRSQVFKNHMRKPEKIIFK
ncbi:phenylacetate--CoA ligase family protein [Fluviicola taffensis]|uniref:AMP-dependent synthetase and ligase n=1 Tax=Fluviicola taffensis (strain DSM 16823 / NCIMB 13979 / RW262) TaxID=755732 RepID=F2IDP4_FLUTR|nr:AMP-binding protein [Fluviicola taffensis]AEA43417.1 AMP-dependent synthetase and ligase [Fluviicola taffensis DSM 16823]